ncbi:MAG: hypothetical protein JSR33_00745 [Proteobacteria bacterium]|nr:hypothetical protein [Pseudomonadota bacterium]
MRNTRKQFAQDAKKERQSNPAFTRDFDEKKPKMNRTALEIELSSALNNFRLTMENSLLNLAYLAETFREIEMCYMTIAWLPAFLYNACMRFQDGDFDRPYAESLPKTAYRITYKLKLNGNGYERIVVEEPVKPENIEHAYQTLNAYCKVFADKQPGFKELYWRRQIDFYKSFKSRQEVKSDDKIPLELSELYQHLKSYEDLICGSALNVARSIYKALQNNPILTTQHSNQLILSVFTGRDVTTISITGARTILPHVRKHLVDLIGICVKIHEQLHPNQYLPAPLPAAPALPRLPVRVRSNSTQEFFKNSSMLLTQKEQQLILESRKSLKIEGTEEAKQQQKPPLAPPKRLIRSTSATQFFKLPLDLAKLKLSDQEEKLIGQRRLRPLGSS